MTEEQRDRLATRWRDEALRQYSAAEPRPGLEARIIASLAAEKQAARMSWLYRWLSRPGIVVAGATAMLLLAVGLQHRHSQNSHPQSSVVLLQREEGSRQFSTVAHQPEDPQKRSATKTSTALVARRATLHSRPAKFPTPGPLSPQERLLLRYLQDTPPEELVAVVGEDRLFEEKALEMEIESQRTTAQ